jgi:hypothetical protein
LDFLVQRLGYYRLTLPLSWQVPDRVDIVLVAIYPLDPALHRAKAWRSLDEVKSYLAAFPEEDFTPDPAGSTVERRRCRPAARPCRRGRCGRFHARRARSRRPRRHCHGPPAPA